MSSGPGGGQPRVTITQEMTLPGPGIRAEDVPALCAELAEHYRRGAAAVECDVGAITEPGLATLDALARLALTARRHGRTLRIRGAGPRLTALLDLTGLAGVLGVHPLRQPGRQPEEREPPRRVQEGVETGDAAP
jgi:hypothetical protein